MEFIICGIAKRKRKLKFPSPTSRPSRDNFILHLQLRGRLRFFQFESRYLDSYTFIHGHFARAVADGLHPRAETGIEGRPVHAHRAIVGRRGELRHRARPLVLRAAQRVSVCRRPFDDGALQGSRGLARLDGRGAVGFVEADAPLHRRAVGGDEAGRFQRGHQSGQGRGRGHRGAFAHSCCAALEWRHEFHAGHRQCDGVAGGVKGSGGEVADGTGEMIAETISYLSNPGCSLIQRLAF